MPHEIGYVQNVGVLAHYMMLEKIRTFALANGYTQLRYEDAIANRELIMRAPGYTGSEQIIIGFQCYQDSSADYYNISCGVFTGYLAGNTFATQPGAKITSVPAHNNRIDYWLTLTPQRITFVLKVGTPVYMPAYAGKLLPYGPPSQFPYPVVCAAPLAGAPATRFSNTSIAMPYIGNTSTGNFSIREPGGAWINPETHPWNNDKLAISTQMRDTNDQYRVLPVVVMTQANGIFGELEGIFYISGFNNAVENTFVIDGKTYVVFQNIYRTGFTDYFAMRLDD